MKSRAPYLLWIGVAALLLCTAQGVVAQLNEHCTVSVLNRNVQVNPNGSWVLPNVPANFGQVRARATCVQNGITRSGESPFFTLSAREVVNLPNIVLDTATQIPVSLSITPGSVSLTAVGQTTQLAVTATYPDSSVADVTAASTGTSYTTSNPALVTVSADGLVTAVASGTVVIQATNDGAAGIIMATVALSSTDTDGDGIPDDVELALGLNPNNAIDAQEDFDRDGLTNLQESQRGTEIRVADTDGDGLSDGQEVALGTHPLLVDTDGDGLRDGLEVQTGSNPTDPTSFNLAQALTSFQVTPSAFVLTVNTIIGEASRQLVVTGNLRDGTTINLTSTARGTNYASSNLSRCDFGAEDGRVFAGTDGTCTITITNSGFSAQAFGTVQMFTPTALSFVSIPGFANNVDVSGDFAYVAAGSAGLQVVDVSDRSAPMVRASLDTAGNANDVKVMGNTAYIADGVAGLQIVDITAPLTPMLVRTIDTPGIAQDVAVKGNMALVADGSTGLQVIDLTTSTVRAVDTPGTAKGVDVAPDRPIAVVADGASGIQVVDISDPTNPTIIGSRSTGGDARDVVLSGNFAFVADFSRSFTVVDITDPRNPVVRTSTPSSTGGLLQDVAVAGRFAFGADVFFVNGVPIIDVSTPQSPNPRAILDFRAFRDDNGTGIAVDSNFVYLTAERGITENGTTGDTRLYIGQYLAVEDTAGIPPTVNITSPAPGATVIEGDTIPIAVEAMDDVAVAAVNFLADGEVVFTDTTAPYQFNLIVPVGVTSLTLGAAAVDLGSNVGVATDVVVNVIPDPGTTVVGRVVDQDGEPVAQATVTCLGVSALTGLDGAFSLSHVPTIRGDIECTATFTTPDGAMLTGVSIPTAAVRAGTTEVEVFPISSEVTYFGFNPNDQGRFILVGWADNTDFRLFRQETGAMVTSGTLNRFQTRIVGLSGIRHFRLEASVPLLATLGFDCCNFGGSFFYPALDGRRMVGREFIIRIPVLSDANEFIIFAYENSQVTMRDAAGNVVTTRTIPAEGFFATTGAPLAAGVVYRVESTGNIAIMSNSRNAHTAVPSSAGTDVGTTFLFGMRIWETSAVAIFAYNNAVVTGTNLETGAQAFTRSLTAGQFAYISGFGNNKFKVVSTGKIAVWAGSTEGGNAINFMGDNLTMNTGDSGRDILIHGQSQGAFLFVLQDNTAVNIDGTVTTLNEGQFRDLPAGVLHHITADKPVIVETIGGNGLNDWETALRLVFETGQSPPVACVPPPPGLVSWWPGDGNAGDLQGTNPGMLQGGTTFAAGLVGQAFSFDGRDDSVDLGSWFNLQTFTIAMWVKAGASQVSFADIIDNNHTGFRSWVVQYDNTGTQYHWGAAGGGQCCVAFTLTPDIWQYLVITRDVSHVSRLYLDGVLVGSAAMTGPITYDGTQFLRLSRWGGGDRHWNGQLDEIAIYDRALTTQEIQAIFTAGSAGQCKP